MKNIKISPKVKVIKDSNRRGFYYQGNVLTYEEEGEVFSLKDGELLYTVDSLEGLDEVPSTIYLKGNTPKEMITSYSHGKVSLELLRSLDVFTGMLEASEKVDDSVLEIALGTFALYEKAHNKELEKNHGTVLVK